MYRLFRPIVVGRIDNGAPLVWNWDHSAKAQGADARALLPSGDIDVVVMTEAMPLFSHMTWSASGENTFKFYDLAVTANPDARGPRSERESSTAMAWGKLQ